MSSQRQLVAKFRDITGASESSALKYLKAHRNTLDAAIDTYLTARSAPGGGSAAPQGPSKADLKNLDKIFDTYTETKGDLRVDIDGTMRYFSDDLGIDLEEPGVLALQTLLGCPSTGVMEKDGFVSGWRGLGVYRLEDMQRVAGSLTTQLDQDKELFKRTYLHTFTLALQPPSRTLPLDVACVYWDLLFTADQGVRGFKRLTQWKAFLQQKAKAVNRDTWNLLYDFLNIVNQDTFEGYDEEDAWPLVFDEFVEHAKAK
ncbi:Scaffold-type E3 ligase [Savitreella phatthalungensis]